MAVHCGFPQTPMRSELVFHQLAFKATTQHFKPSKSQTWGTQKLHPSLSRLERVHPERQAA
jgi:hypothetical protein